MQVFWSRLSAGFGQFVENRGWAWILLAAPIVMVMSFMTMMALERGTTEIRPAPVRVSGEAAIGGPFELVAHTGETVTDETFQGKAMLIYFGFTYCPDACPFSLQRLAIALEALSAEERARFQTLLITVDPARDTVEQMAQYVTSPAFPEGLIGLTGSEDQVRDAAAAYRVAYRRNGEGDDYLMDHSSIIYFMDSNGSFVDIFAHGAEPAMIAARLQDFLEEDRSS